jgi:hypothetical protein
MTHVGAHMGVDGVYQSEPATLGTEDSTSSWPNRDTVR